MKISFTIFGKILIFTALCFFAVTTESFSQGDNGPSNYCIPGPSLVTANKAMGNEAMWCYPSYLKAMSSMYDYYFTVPIKEVSVIETSNNQVKLNRQSYVNGGQGQGPWEGCYKYTGAQGEMWAGHTYNIKVVVENNYYGYGGTNYCMYNYTNNYVFRIFIDFNLDGHFNHLTEWINSPSAIISGKTLKIGSTTTNWWYSSVANCTDRVQEYQIKVADNQVGGVGRMRVMSSYYYPYTYSQSATQDLTQAGNACWNGYAYDYTAYYGGWYGYNYGEIEDYLIKFKPAPPLVVTSNPSGIKAHSVVLGGEVTSDEGAEVYQRGVCWSKTTNPTMSNDYMLIGYGTGVFSSTINYLDGSTKYYYRTFASNSAGTTYGAEKNFTTLQPITLNLPNQTSCSGSSVVLGPQNMITGGSGSYTIYWSPETLLNNPNIAHPTATVNMTTVFNLTVTDNITGELVNGNLTVMVGSRPTVSAPGMYRHPKDTPLNLNSIINISGGTPPYTTSWFTLNGDPVLNVNAFVPPLNVTQFNVIAYDQSGCPSVAKRVTIYVAPRKDVGEVVAGLSNSTYMVAYPNPVESNLELFAAFSQDRNDVTIRVMDMQGKEVYRSKQNTGSELSIRLNLENMTTGAYNVIVETGDDIVIKKIIKQ
jgi:hypothetical protein